jgi:flagellar basal-body rod protein FlgF
VNSGFYAATTGLMAKFQALDVAANNLANSGTTGFKAQKEFYNAMQAQLASPSVSMAGGAARMSPATSAINQAVNSFSVLGGAKTDFAAGSLERTGSEMDVAVNGPGFITVAAPTGTAYTRNGSLSLGSHGELLSSGGAAVLGKNGPIQLPPGQVSIGSDGTISVNGAVVDQIQLAEFDPKTPPLAVGASLFMAAPGAQANPPASSSLQPGFLEGSNMNVVNGSVGLVGLQRNAEMLEKALTMFNNDFNRTAIEQIAKTS